MNRCIRNDFLLYNLEILCYFCLLYSRDDTLLMWRSRMTLGPELHSAYRRF